MWSRLGRVNTAYGIDRSSYRVDGDAYFANGFLVLNNSKSIMDLMAITHVTEERRPTPYTPAGNIGAVLGDLDGFLPDAEAVQAAPDAPADDGQPAVLPELDTALDELAESVDPPELDGDGGDDPGDADAEVQPDDDARERDGFVRLTEDTGLVREQAEFDSVAESTDVDAVPFDDAATFLASDLYTVPPANTRFRWLDEDDVLPAS